MAELLINGADALTTYGICMGKGFADALLAPASPKEYAESKSRLRHGKTILTDNVRLDSRDLTLMFYIKGNSAADFKAKRTAFLNALYKGDMTISVPSLGTEVYHLVYKKSSSYGHSMSGLFCKVAVKFDEPNPTNR